MRSSLTVTCIDTSSLDDAAICAAVDLLSPDERARHCRFVFERDRRDFAVAHALLRRSLSTRADIAPEAWRFTASEHGKPELAPDLLTSTRLVFTLAHTHGLVACAIGHDLELGIDVESIEPHGDALEIAQRFFSPGEVQYLRSCAHEERHARFIEIWTLKEAYIKAVGRGLSLPLDEIRFAFEGAASIQFDAPPAHSPRDWQFFLFAPSDRTRMTLAVRWRATRGEGPTVGLVGSSAVDAVRPIALLRSSAPVRHSTNASST